MPCTGFEFTILVVIGTDCIGSSKSNYHMITATTAPNTIIKNFFQFLHISLQSNLSYVYVTFQVNIEIELLMTGGPYIEG